MTGGAIRVLLADDHAVVRSGLRLLLEAEDGLEVVAEAGDTDGALRAVLGHKPDVLVLDLNMPGMHGIEATAAIVAASPATAVLVLTMYDGRTNLSQQVVSEVQSHFPKEIFQTIIPRNVRLSEAPSYGQTILSYAPASAGALAYQALAAEFMQRMEGHQT